MRIESIRLKNFKIFEDLHLENLPPLAIFVGANGTGKTTLFDVFGFVSDALKNNIRQALQKRGGFKDPFIAKHVSDGTIKMFAYLILLHGPAPHPLLCLEEPENQLYHSLMIELLEEFRDYTYRGGQVFISTHSPDLINGANLAEVYWLVKKESGCAQIKRAQDDELITALHKEGSQLGYLWKQDYFKESHPK